LPLSFRQLIAQTRRLALVLAIGLGLAWLAPPRAHAASDLVHVASRYLGRGNFTHVRGPWCAAAVGRWLEVAGYRRLRSLRAADYARYGRPSGPAPGAIAVMRHHVGIVVGVTRRGPLILSGNHSHRVALSVYAPRKILAYRRPV
jgi:uncharacterized protein (TIGR02594 family)